MTREQATDVQGFLNKHGFTGYQWLIFGLCFLVVLLDGFDTAAIGYIAPSLLAEWHVTRPELGPVLSAALFGLAIGALTAGPLADRLGRLGEVKVRAAIAAMPSITPIGMAAILPGAAASFSIAEKNGKLGALGKRVVVRGRSAGTGSRRAGR